MSLLYASKPVQFNSAAPSCDCLAHVYGNAADHPDRERPDPSDMTDAEWAAVRPLLPAPAWFQGGQPEGYCHRQILDAIRYLVAGGVSWRAMPVDFADWGRVYAFFRRWREHGMITEFHDRLRGRVHEREGREAADGRDHRCAVSEGRGLGAVRLTRLGRREEGGRSQAAHRDRLPRCAAGRRGDRRERRGPGCRDEPAAAAAPPAP